MKNKLLLGLGVFLAIFIATGLTVQADNHLPDLTITDVSFDTDLEMGQPVEVSISVKNLGAPLEDSTGFLNWNISLEDFNWQNGGFPLTPARSITTSSPMLTDETIVFTGTGEFVANGFKAIDLKIDNANELEELNEDNNTWNEEVVVGVYPDLTVEEIKNRADGADEALPATSLVNETLTLESIIGNIGTDISTTTEVLIYVNNIVIGSSEAPGIIAGGTGTINPFWDWTPTSVGTYDLKFVVDPFDNIVELDETNNELEVSIDIIDLDLPDFDITNVKNRYDGADESLPSEIMLGDTLAFEGIVKNIGTVAPTPTTTDMYVYADNVFLGNAPVTGMLPGGSGSNADFLEWTPTSTGSFLLEFDMDPNDDVEELSETNNTYQATVNVVNKDDDDDDEDEDEDDGDKVAVCHYNRGRGYVTIRIDESAWLNGHSKHANDYLKGDGSCGDDDSADLEDEDEDTEVVSKLRERIKKLKYKASDFEVEVERREIARLRNIDRQLIQRLRGRILLQVEEEGEAWYLDTDSEQRYYLKDGQSAYQALQAFGLGITDEDLKKIPIGLNDKFVFEDTDGDGLPDKLENSLGTDPNNPDTDGDGFTDREEIENNFSPLGPETLNTDGSLVERLRGKILLQVEKQGQAWWINPEDGKRYYLKDGDSAYNIMRFLSLGITNDDLSSIDVGSLATE